MLGVRDSSSFQQHLAFAIMLAVLLIATISVAQQVNARSQLDPTSFWNEQTTRLGLQAKLNPPRVARAYALLHVAIYDALLAGTRQHSGEPSERALAAGAVGEVLAYLFPGSVSSIWKDVQAQAWSGETTNRGVVVSGLRFGQMVGKMVVRYAENDGSNVVFTGLIPTGECIWTGVGPLEPMAGTWKTWIVTSGGEFQPEAPYLCGSAKDLADVQAVVDASHDLTPDKVAVVHKWADLPPPTIWNNMLGEWVEREGLRGFAAARAYVYLNIAIYDAFVSTWFSKYTYWTARPFQRVPGLVTVIPTPNFPSYISGHSTVSAAASRVMGQLFPADRDYFSAQAQEAALSRMWAGIHFPHDNQRGLWVGTEVGGRVVDDMLAVPHTFVFPTNEGFGMGRNVVPS